MKRALICGVSGQDGVYLAKLLLEKEYEVFGTSRDAQVSTFANLHRPGVRDRVTTLSMALKDFHSVLHVLNKLSPDEVYNWRGRHQIEDVVRMMCHGQTDASGDAQGVRRTARRATGRSQPQPVKDSRATCSVQPQS
jgi:hypothetical protein